MGIDIAVMTDIHGNFEAFQTCVQYVLKRNISSFIFLGDYVGEFSFPQKTMNLLYELKNRYSCTFIKGNKEDYWLDSTRPIEQNWKKYDSTTGSLYYTYHNLTQRDRDFFASLDIAKKVQFAEQEPITICHGSPFSTRGKFIPDQKETFEIMDRCSTKLILCGHTHIQRTIQYGGKKVINPGAVGVPLYSSGKAQFLILHGTTSGWQEEFVSLTYDVEKEIDELHLADLNQIAPFWCRITEQLLRTGKHSHVSVLRKVMQLCQEEQGECIWPAIPEKYWESGFKEIFGKGNVQSSSYHNENDDFRYERSR